MVQKMHLLIIFLKKLATYLRTETVPNFKDFLLKPGDLLLLGQKMKNGGNSSDYMTMKRIIHDKEDMNFENESRKSLEKKVLQDEGLVVKFNHRKLENNEPKYYLVTGLQPDWTTWMKNSKKKQIGFDKTRPLLTIHPNPVFNVRKNNGFKIDFRKPEFIINDEQGGFSKNEDTSFQTKKDNDHPIEHSSVIGISQNLLRMVTKLPTICFIISKSDTVVKIFKFFKSIGLESKRLSDLIRQSITRRKAMEMVSYELLEYFGDGVLHTVATLSIFIKVVI